jgi:hypothetical protein
MKPLAVGVVRILPEQVVKFLMKARHLNGEMSGGELVTSLAEPDRAIQEGLEAIGPTTAIGVNGILEVANLMGEAHLELMSRMSQLHGASIAAPDLRVSLRQNFANDRPGAASVKPPVDPGWGLKNPLPPGLTIDPDLGFV